MTSIYYRDRLNRTVPFVVLILGLQMLDTLWLIYHPFLQEIIASSLFSSPQYIFRHYRFTFLSSVLSLVFLALVLTLRKRVPPTLFTILSYLSIIGYAALLSEQYFVHGNYNHENGMFYTWNIIEIDLIYSGLLFTSATAFERLTSPEGPHLLTLLHFFLYFASASYLSYIVFLSSRYRSIKEVEQVESANSDVEEILNEYSRLCTLRQSSENQTT